MRSLLAFILSGVAAAFGQEPAAPAEKKQDAEALKLIERFDALMHVPRAAGLKDVEFVTRLPSRLDLVLRWKHPDKVASDLTVAEDAPAAEVEPLKRIIPAHRAEAAKHAASFVKIVTGEVLGEQHKDDDVTLEAPNQIRIVARSDASKAVFKEQALTFDEQGLVKQARVTAPTGLVSTLEPTFAPWKGKHLYQSLKTSIGPDQQTVTFEYEQVGEFMLVKKLTTKSTVRGKATEATLELRGFKANSGLDDKLFEAPRQQ
jgi:hypothetical protein